MKKWSAITLILLGIFAWFRFAVDCFDLTGGDDSGEITKIALKDNHSYTDVLSEISPKSTYTKRPIHTKGYDFVLLVVFTFFFGNFVNTFIRLSDRKFPHQTVTSFCFLRAPPASL